MWEKESRKVRYHCNCSGTTAPVLTYGPGISVDTSTMHRTDAGELMNEDWPVKCHWSGSGSNSNKQAHIAVLGVPKNLKSGIERVRHSWSLSSRDSGPSRTPKTENGHPLFKDERPVSLYMRRIPYALRIEKMTCEKWGTWRENLAGHPTKRGLQPTGLDST